MKSKIYELIGRAVVYLTANGIMSLLLFWGIMTATTLN